MRPVLIIAYYYPPGNWSGAVRPSRFARYLPDYGYTPIIVSAHNVPAEGVWNRFTGRLLGEFEGALSRYGEHLGWLGPATRVAEELVAREQVPVVLSTAPPFSTHLLALRLKQRTGVKWVADFRDPLRGNSFRTGWAGGMYDSYVERTVFRKADWLVANTDALAKMWFRTAPNLAKKTSVIWNGFDPDEEMPDVPPPDAAVHCIRHVGTIYGPRNPSRLIETVERLVKSGRLAAASLRMEFIGTVESDSPLASCASFERLSSSGLVALREPLPRQQALVEVARAGSLLLIDLTGRPDSVQVPAKLFEYVRARRPILAMTTRDSPTDRILARSGLPYTSIYPTDSDAEFERKTVEFFQLPAQAPAISEWFNLTFDARRQASDLARILDELLK